MDTPSASLSSVSSAPTDTPRPPAPPSRAAPLVEGVDYTVENGRWVFTRAFLLRRGFCCTSGCRHCPYGYGPEGRARAEGRTAPDSMQSAGGHGRC
ncbi:MAG: DUF5522 domain-containing protein [Tepidisphaerales bacterium]